jgi:RNA polymerase sigma factor for flagellar operon FliA
VDARRARTARKRTQARLWRSYLRRRESALRNELVESYQPFAQDLVRRFAAHLPRSVEIGDLETAGSVGLMNAIESFDPERGVRFESYCELRVKGALLDELRQLDWLPRRWRRRLERHKRARERLLAEHNREPSQDELARELELSPSQYRRFFGGVLPGANGARPRGSREEFSSLEVVADTQSDAPGEKLSRDELLRLVAQRLTEQEYRIVYLKYWEELSMREIGQLEGLSESRVCKIHLKLLGRLKDRLRAADA